MSTPTSANYGKFLTKEQIVQRFAPKAENLQLVLDFLKNEGVTDARVSELKDFIHFKMPASLAEKVLDTKFAMFKSEVGGVSLLRVTQPYSLPSEIASVVALVDDILRFPSIRQPLLVKKDAAAATVGGDAAFNSCGATCAGFTTPQVEFYVIFFL